jgi:hypothetical protein
MKRFNILLMALLLISLSSCKKFLDMTPTNSADADQAIKTPKDAAVAMNGIMRAMTSSDYYGRNFLIYGDAKGGDFTIYSQGRGLDGLYTFNHAADNGSYSGFWSQIYYCLLQVNNLLENIQKQESLGITGFNTTKGQALTARALMYFDLVRLYGKVYDQDKNAYGVPLILTKLSTDAQPLRATVEQNYTQIVKDLTDAAPLLPKTKVNGYLNYYANKAILAKVYLYMKSYGNSLTAAEEVINATSLYSLYTNANWVSSWTTQFGSESIFELGMVPLENDLTTSSLGIYHRRRNHGVTQALGFFLASDYFLARLGQDAGDVRWGVMAADETSNTRLGALYKYSGNTALLGDGKATNTAVNIKVIRLSEVYLIAAEAALTSDPGKAVGYLNQIRKRAPNLAPATTGTITLDMILDERSKELYGEGQRFFDMMRLNKSITFNDELGGISVPQHRTKTIDRTFYKTILPISLAEINANPPIKAQQNPGY